jgi:hypothetical protein
MSKNRHVTYNQEEKSWDVLGEGDEQASVTYENKQDAIAEARRLTDDDAQVIIHDQEGNIISNE